MKRIIEFHPAFDRRSVDPNKNYGAEGVKLRMILKGWKGAVQFVLYTNWQLPHVTEERLENNVNDNNIKWRFLPMPDDLGYHSFIQEYVGQSPMKHCNVLFGGTCYYDGSTLNAERIFKVLLKEGNEGVWRELSDYYKQTFDSHKWYLIVDQLMQRALMIVSKKIYISCNVVITELKRISRRIHGNL